MIQVEFEIIIKQKTKIFPILIKCVPVQLLTSFSHDYRDILLNCSKFKIKCKGFTPMLLIPKKEKYIFIFLVLDFFPQNIYCHNPTQQQLNQTRLRLDTIINPNPPHPPTTNFSLVERILERQIKASHWSRACTGLGPSPRGLPQMLQLPA